jgi:hypothetical protein
MSAVDVGALGAGPALECGFRPLTCFHVYSNRSADWSPFPALCSRALPAPWLGPTTSLLSLVTKERRPGEEEKDGSPDAELTHQLQRVRCGEVLDDPPLFDPADHDSGKPHIAPPVRAV